MGFNSFDDMIQKITVNNNRYRAENVKTTGASTYTAGRVYDLSMVGGFPAANTYTGTALAAQVADDTSGYGIYHGGNVSSATKHLINMAAMTTSSTGFPSTLYLIDLLGYYPGLSLTSSAQQNLVQTNPITRRTNGAGVRAFLVDTVASGAGATTMVMNYTNQTGTAGQITPSVSLTASAIVGHMLHTGLAPGNYAPFLPLASGDYGIRSVQSVTFTTPSAAGSAALVLCNPIASIPLILAVGQTERDLVNQFPSLPKIDDGACLTWVLFTGAGTATSSQFYTSLEFAWG